MRSMTKLLMLLCLLVVGRCALAQSTGTVTYVYTDPQGTPLAEADAGGNITAAFDYTPYGTAALGTPPSGPGYTGHVNDAETNLVYMQARYYDPATGHFLSADPVHPSPGNSFNFNRYAYVDNNPIIGVDPTGMEDACPAVCMFMRRVSDSFSRIASGAFADANGSSSGMMGRQGQATVSYMNGAVNQDLASASAAVAPMADNIPGITLGACIAGVHCSSGDWIMGGLYMLPGEGIEVAEGTPLIAEAIHGNSVASSATSYLYRLTSSQGGLLKWGISKNPLRRYTLGFMVKKDLQIMTSGSRRDMLNLERWIVERDPGPLNLEPWAGAKSGDVP